MPTCNRVLALFLFISPAVAVAEDKPAKPSPEGIEYFEKHVRPVLVKHCYSCHSAAAKKIKGDFRLDTRETIARAIVPGDPAKSVLIHAIKHINDAPKMPPEGKLKAEEIAALEAWVKMGAPHPRDSGTTAKTIDIAKGKEFWSFRAVVTPTVPKIRAAVANPIDAFILAKLSDKGLSLSPRADKRTLIRRVTYDLTGLPPTPEEVEAFLKDDSPNAYEKLIERLLASRAYGERWGRHWMDVIRYADTAGDNSDYPIPQMYRYRDWIIDAVNRDLPYDEFVRQQIAGDLMPFKDEADRQAKLIATGYLANTKRFGSYEEERYPWYLTYEDQIDNFGRAFLGLTIACARCHDHKFDPVTQNDYYSLYGFFSSTRYPRPGIELDKVQRDFIPLAPPEKIADFEKERRARMAELDAKVKATTQQKSAAEKELAAAEKIADEAERKAKIAEGNKKVDSLKQQIKAAQSELEKYAKQPLPFETAYAVAEGKTEGKRKVGNARVQLKGDPERLGAEVPRRFLEVLGGQKLPASETGSGRLQLANWVADAKNPLTTRVMVNRVWQYHFGKGLVRTASNFGTLGEPPTHAELLDWLAARFVADKWSVKSLHKLILLSQTYQQSSHDNDTNAKIDQPNDYYWRFDRRRLDAESIRDTLLVLSGALDITPSGAHPFPEPKTWNFTQHNPFKAVYDSNKRSVYLMTQRIQRHPFLALFDGPDTNASTATRNTSTTPLQALYLLNDPFVHRSARGLVAVVHSQKNATDAERIQRLYSLLLSRPATEDEISAAQAYLAKAAKKIGGDNATVAAWESLTRALFLSNEFVYLD